MLGAHLDSVLDGPGLNDNASGVSTLLALAESLAAGPQPRLTVRFGFWAAEEFGTLGSASYVRGLSGADAQRIRAYLNLDMVGSPNAARFVYQGFGNEPGGVADGITQSLLAAFDALDAPAIPVDLGGGSDHAQFDARGIPTGGVFSGLSPLTEEEASLFGGVAGEPADPCYHLACDVRSNVDVDAAVLLGSAIAAVVEELAL
jgi:aminopeptidase S